ncbi:MAG: HEAT repeat domain-containing protein [Proteobacteria bacterium]|nr:HEAT repeat domain-containing protein [Pseudomonadota bacterium]MBU1649541.1 HEAT repeat domain-containing protein [Pseudomonadota bacterium]MBU1985792.1 HEAT repeat domain-containing protein [Pseudomonadota bacterium]
MGNGFVFVERSFCFRTKEDVVVEVSDIELKKVIGDFLDMGHVDNIVAMFRREPRYYAWTGEILNDPRFQVRLGVSVLFEELRAIDPGKIDLATPSLLALLHSVPSPPSYVRGEAVSVLAIIGSDMAMEGVRAMMGDSDPQLVEVARDILGEGT